MLEFIACLLAILTLRKVFSYVKYGNVEKKVIKAVFSRSELTDLCSRDHFSGICLYYVSEISVTIIAIMQMEIVLVPL